MSVALVDDLATTANILMQVLTFPQPYVTKPKCLETHFSV